MSSGSREDDALRNAVTAILSRLSVGAFQVRVKVRPNVQRKGGLEVAKITTIKIGHLYGTRASWRPKLTETHSQGEN